MIGNRGPAAAGTVAGMTAAPWPEVPECHWPAVSLVAAGHTCRQCDGSHEHEWVAWPDAPAAERGHGVPVRCRDCGGRKCDMAACRLRRHHRGDHELY